MQPLEGVKVIDFSQYLSGPYCTMQLADQGADVIKIERPQGGDDSRVMAPFVEGESYPSAMPNRNKRSVTIDLKNQRGRELIHTMVAQADIVVESFRPGVMERLELDYAALKEHNPDLIYCSVTGYGQTGPNSHRAGFDIIAQGMAGFLRMTGPEGGEPAKFGVAVTDLTAGLTAANAILAAYIHRLRGGGGQYIDVSLLDAGLALTVWEAGAWFGAGLEPTPQGSRHRYNAPYQAFKTSDGYVTIGANNQRLWERLCQDVLENDALATRQEYDTPLARAEHSAQLADELQETLITRPTEHWVSRLDAAGVPGGPVLSYGDALQQEQVKARDMVVEIDHPKIGRMFALGPPAKMSQTPQTVRRPAPMLGEHTHEVLSEFGLSGDDVEKLEAGGAIA